MSSLSSARGLGPHRLPLLLLLAGCGGAPDVGPPPGLAPGPGLDPAVVAAVADARAAVLREPSHAGARRELGLVLDANGLHELACTAYGQALALDPTDVRARYHRAVASAEVGRIEEALADLEVCAREHPRHAPVHWRSGRLLLELGRLDGAEAAFARAAEVGPGEPGAAVGLARVALERGAPDEALAYLGTLPQPIREGMHVRGLRARAHRALGDVDRARALLADTTRGGEGGLWRDPWRNEVAERMAGRRALVSEARQLLRGGRPGRALTLLDQLAGEGPVDVTLLGMQTAALVQLGRLEDALARLERAEEELPPHFQTALNRGTVLAALERPAEARAHLERAVELNPASGASHAKLGEVLLGLGDATAAREALERAVARGTDGEAVRRLLEDARAAESPEPIREDG